MIINTNKQNVPLFTTIGILYQNTPPPILPTTSINGLGGTWSPAAISTATAGKTTYTFTPTDPCGTTVTITVSVEIKAAIAGATLIGACQQAQLDASKSIGDIVKYEWSLLGQGGVLTRQSGIYTEFLLSPNYTGLLPANFSVKLTITDNLGNTGSDIITIKIDRSPVAEVYSSGKLEKDGSMIVDGSISTGTGLNYRWFTNQGNIIGFDNKSTVNLFGAGNYSLQVTDIYGCQFTKTFKFPLENHEIVASPDYARISWAQDTTLNVLGNDRSTVKINSGSVRIITQPMLGGVKVNANGTITYSPHIKLPGRDQFVYEMCDILNFCDSALVTIDIYNSGVTTSEGFSPNGDGQNEYFVFVGLQNYPKSQLYVYTRAGQLVYQSLDYQNDWDGTSIQNNMTTQQLTPPGTYYYILKLGDTNRYLKGFVYIGY